MYITCTNLLESFNLNKNDVVFVSSDLTSLMWISRECSDAITPAAILDGIQHRIGTGGTLILPTYNWEFCQGKGFDYSKSRCKTGALGVAALKRNDFKRTKHPIYSFAVWGKDKSVLCKMNNFSSFGSDSPFAYLHNNAINIIIDVDYKNCFTFTHYVEEQVGLPVPYRFQKTFEGDYTAEDGKTEHRSYSMLVRSYEMETTNTINPMGCILEKEGVSRKYEFGGATIRILKMGDAFPYFERDIKENRSRNICIYKGQG